MRNLYLYTFVSFTFLISANCAKTLMRRDGGNHNVKESENVTDSVEFIQHIGERDAKARKLVSDGSSNTENEFKETFTDMRHLSGMIERLTRLPMPLRKPLHLNEANTADNSENDQNLMNKLWLQSFLTRRTFQIECCRGGMPEITHSDLVRNFTYHAGEYRIRTKESDISDETNPLTNLNCRMYHGMYSIPSAALLSFELNHAIQVVCKCPNIGTSHILDKNCKLMAECKNNGFRSSTKPQKCLCVPPFFGEKCEKFCDRGQLLPGLNRREYCNCSPYFTGDECREMVCLNGGSEENGRCVCPPQYLGYHCEVDTNRTHTPIGAMTLGDLSTRNVGSNGVQISDGTRFQRYGDHVSNEMFTRDVSGTIFSLIMIIVLVVSMYLLMKHRMQARYLNRRTDLLGACNFPGAPAFGSGIGALSSTARRVELMPAFDEVLSIAPTSARTFPFRNFVCSLANTFIPGEGGPPPYIASGQRGRRGREDVLPPLPSYEDATKLPPLRQNIGGEQINDPPIEMTATRNANTETTEAQTLPASNLLAINDTQNLSSQQQQELPSEYTPRNHSVIRSETISLQDGDNKQPTPAKTTNSINTNTTIAINNKTCSSKNNSRELLSSNERRYSAENSIEREKIFNNEGNRNVTASSKSKNNEKRNERHVPHGSLENDDKGTKLLTTMDGRHTSV